MSLRDQSVWRFHKPLLLASSSASRAHLLKAAKIPFTAVDPEVDERAFEMKLGPDHLNASELAVALATAKARDVSKRVPGSLVLGADQTLDLDGAILSKVRSKSEARDRLKLMAGRTHNLYSAFTVILDDRIVFSSFEAATLTMRNIEPDFLRWYMDAAGDAVLKSVGCYELEGIGIHLFNRIEGEHSTILGLPLLPILAFFRSAEYLD